MKQNRRRILMIALAISLIAGLLSGCGGGAKTPGGQPASPAPAVKKADAAVAMGGDAVSLDPHDTNDNLSYGIENTIYEGLIGFDNDMKVIPVLAESWTGSEDAKTFTFKLRQGIKFHTGEALNADAVKKSFLRVADPNNKLKRNSLFANIASIDTPDPSTVVFHLKEPFGAMLYNFAHPAGKVIAPSGVDKGKEELARNPRYGTGPFTFKEWVANDHVTVVKNPEYWNKQGMARVNSLTFKPITEASTRVAGLKTGDLDFALPIPGTDAIALKSDQHVKVSASQSIYAFYVAMNVTKKPYSDKLVREALNLAIDREALRKGVLRGFADPATSVLAPNVSFYVKQGDEIKRDVAKAKDLLKQAGYPKGFETEMWLSNLTERKDLAAAIQQQLAEVGIKLKLTPMDNASMASNLWTQDKDHAKVQLYMGGWSSSTGDADWAIRPLLYGEMAPPKGYNVGFYNNSRVNELVKAGLATADATKRAEVYADLQKVIWDDKPWVFLFVPQNLSASGAKVSGIFVQGDGIVNYNGIGFTD